MKYILGLVIITILSPIGFILFSQTGGGLAGTQGSSGGGAPSGPAGGDLSGTYPNPSITGLALSKLATQADQTTVCNVSGSTAVPIACTAAQVRTMIDSARLSAANNFTTNGALSLPGNLFSGTWFSGGSATTTKPQILIECNSGTTTSNTWSTAGTGLGINACTGFTGDLIKVLVNGSQRFLLDTNGLTTSNGFESGSNYQIKFQLQLTSPSAGVLQIGDGSGLQALLKVGQIQGNSTAPAVAISGTGTCTLGTPSTGSNNITGRIPVTGSCTAATLTVTYSGTLGYTNGSNCGPVQDITSGQISPMVTGTSTLATFLLTTIAASDVLAYNSCFGY